jgi:DNA-binding LacI/PurR family transcriptional regulator/signal transduction histidine kinase/CheY-like chemotaxis protein
MRPRRVIVLLTNNTGSRADYQGLLRQGVEHACVERDIDLWLYAGRSDWRPTGAVQSHVYRLIAPDRIDGIVVAAGCMATTAALENVLELIRTCCQVPTCAIGQRCSTVPSVIVDNAAGAAALARHVVMVHERRCIAYVAGPAGHEESDERLNSTREALAHLHVALPPTHVVHGNFSSVSALEGTQELLRRGLAFDALIAANDDMAVGALEALEAAGIRCPKDVVVAGFDDAPSSRACTPSLTTVRQPIAQLGARAVARLTEAWGGNSASSDLVMLETELVLRESCGCYGAPRRSHDSVSLLGPALPSTRQSSIADSLAPLLHFPDRCEEWARALCAALDAELVGNTGTLLRAMLRLLDQLSDPDAPLHELQQVIACLRRTFVGVGITTEVETAFHDALVQVGLAIHRREGKRRLHDEDLTERLRANWERLASSLNFTDLRACLVDQLPRLSIMNGFVATYARGDLNFLIPLACVTDGQPVELDTEPYPASWLMPRGVLATRNRCSLAVLPLTSERQPIGVAVLELPYSHELYAVLREQIGSAVKIMQLYEDMLAQAQISAQAQEEKRATAERFRSLALIAGGVAHDLNNALGPMVGLTETIARDLTSSAVRSVPSRVLEDLETVRQAGLRAADTIRDLMALGQPNVMPKRTFELNDALLKESRAIIALACLDHHVRVEVSTIEQPLWVHASKPHLLRAISNLVINAADAIQGEGTITVKTSTITLAQAVQGIETIEAGNYALVEVEDTGCGIAPENLEHILEPFFSSKPPGRRGGTGLGLAIVHRIIKDLLGFIDVVSQVGVGSKFYLYLPMVVQSAVTTSSRPAPAPGGTGRILVVDDEPMQLRTASRILEQLGYKVTIASSGEAAVALFDRRPQDSEFELVIVDMMMPGMDGLMTLERIRSTRPEQRALVVTGYAPQQADSEMRGLAWLRKPYTSASLGHAVHVALES